MNIKISLVIRLVFCTFFMTSNLHAQNISRIEEMDERKLSPHIKTNFSDYSLAPQPFLVHVNDGFSFEIFLKKEDLDQHVLYEYKAGQSFILEIPASVLMEKIIPCPQVVFVDDRSRTPQEERAIDGFDLGINGVSYLHSHYPGLSGENQTISIKESRFDSLDIDFKNRHLPSDISAPSITTHATNMATMAGGGGNAAPTSKGVAWKAKLSSSNFLNLYPDDIEYFQESGISIQNHSYGLGIENYYGSEAFAYDDQVYQYPDLVHVFSAGNMGDTSSTTGTYQGLDGFANLTGTFKMSKNILTVGAIDSTLEVALLSSKGPAYDGRIKPELVAFGASGSSGAAAITSGVVALVQEVYMDQLGTLPPAGLVRSVLLNSADDLGSLGPDYASGYGNLNALEAVETVDENRIFSGSIEQGATKLFSINIPENACNFKATLTWIDPPASINGPQALVNDLDFKIKELSNSQIVLPWILSSFPHADSLQLSATRGVDRLNNQEQISLAHPSAGSYEFQVEAFNISEGPQEFFIAFSWDKKFETKWLYPTSGDHLRANTKEPIRWKSTLEAEFGQLEYSFIGADEWIMIEEQADLKQAYTYWTLPDTNALVQLRMTAGASQSLSDTFSISQAMTLALGFDCPDSLQLVWEDRVGVDSYQVLTMGATYLEPFSITEDTFLVLSKTDVLSNFFSVAPVIEPNHLGRRSPTLNLDFQFAGCFIKNFLVNLIDDKTLLKLSIGTLYQVESITFEKKINGTFLPKNSFDVNNKFEYEYEDLVLEDGNNTYRAAVNLQNGQTIYSEELSVFYTSDNYFIFPNPISQQEDVDIISKKTNDAVLFLYDGLGRLTLKFEILSPYETIPTQDLPIGVYFYKVLYMGNKEAEGKLLIH